MDISFEATPSHEVQYQALPPWAQIAREKEAILDAPRLLEILGEESIDKIRCDEEGYAICKEEVGYTVIAGDQKVRVDVMHLPRTDGLVGPLPFALVFEELVLQ